MAGIYDGIKTFFGVPFNLYLAIFLVLLGAAALLWVDGAQAEREGGELAVNYFYLPTCPHCAEQRPILVELAVEMENVSIAFHDASTPEGSMLFYELASEAGMDISRLGVPTTFVGRRALVGFHSKEEIAREIGHCMENCRGENGAGAGGRQELATGAREFDLPFLGRTDLTAVSLPALAIILGIVDGFNPCAMWVLVYLIALLMNVNDRRKFWIIIGSFVLASGVLYFLFMTAWLNAFLLLGYIRAVTVAIGVVALGGGVLSLKEYFTTKGELTCKVGDLEAHRKTEGRIQEIISSPLSPALIISIIALAFVVNSVEFACSSAIPAVFTQVLAISGIGVLEQYAYISLYVLFFMLDDLAIFGLAGFAVAGGMGSRYAKYCKAIGGAIMVALGMMMLFAPSLLR